MSTPTVSKPDVVFDLPEGREEDLKDVYERLVPVAEAADEDRPHLRQIHVDEKGWAAATDAHVLAVVPVQTNGESLDYPVLDRHVTDTLLVEEETNVVRNLCSHKTDKSDEAEATPSEENPDSFPDVASVYPETDEHLRIKLKREYLIRILNLLGEGAEDESCVLEFCVTEYEDVGRGINPTAPVKVIGEQGACLVMPVRLANDEERGAIQEEF